MAIVEGTQTLRRLTAFAYLVLALGCQGEPTTVSGLVTLDGQPLAIREGMRGTVVFQPTSGDGRILNGIIDAAGRFELAEGSNCFVTPSVYWVTVSAVELMPPGDEGPRTGKRITPAKYASATDSGFRIEVVPGPNEVNLALKSDAEPPTNAATETSSPEQTDHTDKNSAEASAAAPK